MQILKRAKGDSGETVSFRAKEEDLRDEVNRRSHKAGYTDRDGQPPLCNRGGAGKGDAPRPMNKKKFNENYDRIEW